MNEQGNCRTRVIVRVGILRSRAIDDLWDFLWNNKVFDANPIENQVEIQIARRIRKQLND